MENMKKEELNRAKDILTMPEQNPNDAIAKAIDFLNSCNKKNPSASNARKKKAGLFSVDVSFDNEKNIEDNYVYKFSR